LTASLICGAVACRTVSTESDAKARRSSIKPPIFPVLEWQSHRGGPLKEPFFLQTQPYTVEVALDAKPTSKEKIAATFTINDGNGEVLTDRKISIKLRGFTSLDFPKKQYGINIVNDQGKDAPISILGMAAADEWVLSAPYNDKSLLRDILTYNLSNLIGRRAPKTRIVNLILNVTGQAPENMGIYVITEKNTFGPGRIDVPKKNEKGTAFLATFDHQHEGDNVIWSGRETDVILEYPSLEKITPEQSKEFLTKFNDVEALVSNPKGQGWDNIFEDHLDLSSAVDFFIIQELARNIDGFRLSSSFYIPPKGKIFFGPLWDFNIAYGNASHENGIQYEGWRSQEKGVWFGPLLAHPKFCKAMTARWTAARSEGSLSNDTIFNVIDQQAKIMEPLVEQNFKRWPSLGKHLWPNPYWLASWQDEKDALKSWISLRTEWMDKTVAALDCDAVVVSPPPVVTPNEPDSGEVDRWRDREPMR